MTDMNAAKEVFGKNVIITVGRSHVAEMCGKCPGDLRKREMKRLRKELPEEEYKKMKGPMHYAKRMPI